MRCKDCPGGYKTFDGRGVLCPYLRYVMPPSAGCSVDLDGLKRRIEQLRAVEEALEREKGSEDRS